MEFRMTPQGDVFKLCAQQTVQLQRIEEKQQWNKQVAIFTQQNSFSISPLLSTVTKWWLDSDSVVNIANWWQHGDWAVNGSVVTVLPAVNNIDYIVTAQSPGSHSDWWNRSFAVYFWNIISWFYISQNPMSISTMGALLRFLDYHLSIFFGLGGHEFWKVPWQYFLWPPLFDDQKFHDPPTMLKKTCNHQFCNTAI